MAYQEGGPPHKRQEGRVRLGVSDPLVNAAVAAITFEGFNLGETRRFGNRLAAEARRFRSGRIGGERGRISKRDAAVLLGMALAKIAKDGDL